MYAKKQKYLNSCFPCSLTIALKNCVFDSFPDDYIEDTFNSEMKKNGKKRKRKSKYNSPWT